MSTLTRAALRKITSFRTSALPPTHSFHISSTRTALSESDHDQDPGSRKDAIYTAKDQQLKEQKEGTNDWKKELSTDSEAALKADRGEIGEEDIASLQKKSAGKMEENHQHGKK